MAFCLLFASDVRRNRGKILGRRVSRISSVCPKSDEFAATKERWTVLHAGQKICLFSASDVRRKYGTRSVFLAISILYLVLYRPRGQASVDDNYGTTHLGSTSVITREVFVCSLHAVFDDSWRPWHARQGHGSWWETLRKANALSEGNSFALRVRCSTKMWPAVPPYFRTVRDYSNWYGVITVEYPQGPSLVATRHARMGIVCFAVAMFDKSLASRTRGYTLGSDTCLCDHP